MPLEHDLQVLSYKREDHLCVSTPLLQATEQHRFSRACQTPSYQKWKSRLLKLSFGGNQEQTKSYFSWLKIFIWKHCFQVAHYEIYPQETDRVWSRLLLLQHAAGREPVTTMATHMRRDMHRAQRKRQPLVMGVERQSSASPGTENQPKCSEQAWIWPPANRAGEQGDWRAAFEEVSAEALSCFLLPALLSMVSVSSELTYNAGKNVSFLESNPALLISLIHLTNT